MIPVTAPLRVRDRLSAAPAGPRPVVHRGPHAIYVDLDGHVVGLVSATATRVPCALWSAVPDLLGAGITGERAEVVAGGLVLDGQPLRIARLTDPRVPASISVAPSTSAFTDELVDRLVGLGPGLTPLGDDVLAGWLLARFATGSPDHDCADAVRRRAGRTTPLSATLLDCAARGESLPELTAWLRARNTAAEAGAIAALMAVGGSSGAGLLAGARLALAPQPGPSLAPSSLIPSNHVRSAA